MFRYKFESNSQLSLVEILIFVNVYAMLRYKFESNSQRLDDGLVVVEQCVCYA